MIIKYKKAVRDKIPDIIQSSGKKCKIKHLSDKDFLPELEKKLIEEVEEYYRNKSVEELADLLEVIYSIAELKGISKNKLEEMRIGKRAERGSFRENKYLIETF